MKGESVWEWLREPHLDTVPTRQALRELFRHKTIHIRGPQKKDSRRILTVELRDPADPRHRLTMVTINGKKRRIDYDDFTRGISLSVAERTGEPYYETLTTIKLRIHDMALSRPSVAPADGHYIGATEAKYWQGLSTLISHMTDLTWEDGSPRTPCTLTLFFQSGYCKAMIKCKDTGRVAFCSSPTWGALFEDIETGLTTGLMEWRNDRQQPTSHRGPRRQ